MRDKILKVSCPVCGRISVVATIRLSAASEIGELIKGGIDDGMDVSIVDESEFDPELFGRCKCQPGLFDEEAAIK